MNGTRLCKNKLVYNATANSHGLHVVIRANFGKRKAAVIEKITVIERYTFEGGLLLYFWRENPIIEEKI